MKSAGYLFVVGAFLFVVASMALGFGMHTLNAVGVQASGAGLMALAAWTRAGG